jgi:hypothetical protein
MASQTVVCPSQGVPVSSSEFAIPASRAPDEIGQPVKVYNYAGVRVSPRMPARWISGLLAFLAVGLGGMWIANSVRFAVTGAPPPGSALVETPTVVHLGYVVAPPFQARAGVPDATAIDLGEPPIALAFLLATTALLVRVRGFVPV